MVVVTNRDAILVPDGIHHHMLLHRSWGFLELGGRVLIARASEGGVVQLGNAVLLVPCRGRGDRSHSRSGGHSSPHAPFCTVLGAPWS